MRQPGEEAPIGLFLYAESNREQVGLLQMHKDGMTVAEYWTELPPKAALEQKLHASLVEARVFYVAATRATQRLVIGVDGEGGFRERFGGHFTKPQERLQYGL